MDIGKAFTFINDDKKWVEKLGIGIGLIIFSFLVIPVFILNGYAVRLLQNVRDGREEPLPDWDEWGGDLLRGFKMWLIQIIWALPLILFSMPVVIGAAIADTGSAGEFVGVSLMLCAGCLALLYGLFVALAAPGYTISFAYDESIGKGLALTAIWRWTQQNLGQVIIAALVILAAGFIVMALAGIVGLILCGVGLFLTIPLASVILVFFQNHLYGQLAHEYPMYGTPSAVEPTAPAPVVPTKTAEVVPGEEIVDDVSTDDDAPPVDDGTTGETDSEIVDEQATDEAIAAAPVVSEQIDEQSGSGVVVRDTVVNDTLVEDAVGDVSEATVEDLVEDVDTLAVENVDDASDTSNSEAPADEASSDEAPSDDEDLNTGHSS